MGEALSRDIHMDIMEDIKAKYRDYRLAKMDRLARAQNAREGRIHAASTSPGVILPNKLKIKLKTLPKQLAIAKDAERAITSVDNNPARPKVSADEASIKDFEAYARSLGIAKIGYTEIPGEYIFNGRSVAYTHAIVLTMEIPKAPIDAAPGPATQAIGIVTYRQMGDITNKLADHLRKNGYAAEAGPPAIGPALYPPLAIKAGLGNGGRHGLLITPDFGPRQRISAIFTSIGNLPVTDSTEHAWTQDFCASCGNCIRKCPGKAIYETPIKHDDGRLSHIDGDKCISCTICMKECSFNKQSYAKIKEAYLKKACTL
jgi:epoxyqueuosine reductase